MRTLFCLLSLLSLLFLVQNCTPPTTSSGESAADAATQDATPEVVAEPEPPKNILSVFSANVGHLGARVNGVACQGYYKGAMCVIEQEKTVRKRIDELKPDIAILMEVFDSEYCKGRKENTPGHVCTELDKLKVRQQIRRLTGDDYTLVCDGIAHFDCIAVKTSKIKVKECPDGQLCMGKADTPPHPDDCKKNGSITSVSRVHLTMDGNEFTTVFAHPLNAVTKEDDPCRLAQYKQALTQLPTGKRNLIAGDMNGDPYRARDVFPSFGWWHTRVGKDQAFQVHNPFEDGLPLSTWSKNVNITLDYVLSDFLKGTCKVLGKSPGTTRIDAPLNTMDHRAMWCELEWKKE